MGILNSHNEGKISNPLQVVTGETFLACSSGIIIETFTLALLKARSNLAK
jgi:hypothetical protein